MRDRKVVGDVLDSAPVRSWQIEVEIVQGCGVMLGCEVRRVSWGKGPEQANAKGRGAVEEQQPRTLQVRDVRDSLKQVAVLKQLLRQLVRDERTAPNRATQHNYPLL